MHAKLLLPLVLLAGCARPAPVATVTPICGRPDVLGFVEQTLHRRGPYLDALRDTVGEVTEPLSDVSRCAVYVRQLAFDTDRTGRVPAERIFVLDYRVRRVPAGFVVDVAPIPPG